MTVVLSTETVCAVRETGTPCARGEIVSATKEVSLNLSPDIRW